jgi:integrase
MTKVTLHKVVRPRRNGTSRLVWTLRWYGTDGKRRGETVGDVKKVSRRQAQAARRAKQSKLDCGIERPERPRRMTLADFLRRDREAVAIDLKPKTILELRAAADHATAALGRDFDVRRLDHAAVGRIKKHLADKKLSAATICKVIRHLQGAFSRGVRLRLVASNPFHGVMLPKVQPNAVRVYRAEEIETLIAISAGGWWRCTCGATGPSRVETCTIADCPGRVTNHEPSIWWETLIRLAHTSGLRHGELLNLRWTDVDLKDGTVSVQPKKAGSVRVAEQTYPILPWTSKSYQNRTVPIPDATVAVLRRLKARSAGSPYVFISLERLADIGSFLEARGGHLDPNYKLVPCLHLRFHRLQQAAAAHLAQHARDVPEWERRGFHDLRRTYGTIMARHVPMHELKALMGHSSIWTTERYYLAAAHISEKVRAAFGPRVVKAG